MRRGDVYVRGFPRLHFGLLDVGRATRRAFGGSGAAIDGLSTLVRATVGGGDLIVIGEDAHRSEIVFDILKESKLNCPAGLRIEIVEGPTHHIGLGSETTLRLACIAAAAQALEIDLTDLEMQEISRRGGASGIGIHAFFDGGFLVDGGHRSEHVESLVPSSAVRRRKVPPVLCRFNMPYSWVVRLMIPYPRPDLISGEDELRFFREATPVPQAEVLHSISNLYHGVVPSILEEDFEGFKDGLLQIQQSGFKRREIARYGTQVADLLSVLNSNSETAAGMSSMGPVIFTVHKSQSSSETAATMIPHETVSDLGLYRFRNAGFVSWKSQVA